MNYKVYQTTSSYRMEAWDTNRVWAENETPTPYFTADYGLDQDPKQAAKEFRLLCEDRLRQDTANQPVRELREIRFADR